MDEKKIEEAASAAVARAVGGLKSWGLTLALVAASAAAGSVLTAWRSPATPAETVARKSQALGKAYLRSLGTAYAESWRKGAEALDAGKPVADSLAVVSEAWGAGRVAAFDRQVAPAFSAVVPQGKPDADVPARDKAALAACWRAFASGLEYLGK